ncbi:hypothetical protein TrispH2_009572 [Trichoplax sp. H2]|nr:hypothetical protein TrispH2_009572 [Trichoplax sp. H2]|eukprot:RDD38038.1 hypothetical protein TrispH2_009572 [Trichoplax sp. H2]
MMSVLSKCVMLNTAIQLGGYVMACLLQTEKFYDLFGSGTFTILAIQSLRWGGSMHLRQRIHTVISCLQTTRLGLFLFARILHDGKDRRFNNVRNNPSTFFIYWFLQYIWVMVTTMPVTTVNATRQNLPLTKRDYIGWSLAIAGTIIESLADYQKFTFKADPVNADRFINIGLWRLCRHPNYLGEILHWTGMFIASTSVVKGRYFGYSLLSPLLVTFLLTRVSGIPILERIGMKKWGNDPQYQQYLANTKKLIPYIW